MDWTWQIIGTVRITLDPNVSPTDLLTIHYYWVQILTTTKAALFVLSDVESLMTKSWLRVSDQGFWLRNPGVTTPALKAACASAAAGWTKIGAVLLAACNVIPAAIPPEMVTRFNQLLSNVEA